MSASASSGQAEPWQSYVSQAKQEAKHGNLEKSIQLFRLAHEIHPSEKLKTYIKKVEDALASLSLEQEDDGFVDVCLSGLMLYGELYNRLGDHQREGVAFLYHSYREGRTGSILADDMGLGKTIQIIAFLSGMFDSELIRSVLLIMPTTLIGNWMKEFSSWTPNMRVNNFHGTNKAKRNRNLERIQRKKGVLLTTYNMLLTNWQQLSTFGGKEFVWDYIILDEAHKIKSPSAKTTKSLQRIPSQNRILLTGTPVQNNLKELWALFDYACQGSLLGTSKTFRVEYENPITRARAKDATPGEKALGLKISENLMSIIKPYFLRRIKDEIRKNQKPQLEAHHPEDQREVAAHVISSLPRKNEFVVWIYLAPTQEEIYKNFLSLEHIKGLLMAIQCPLAKQSPLAEINVLKMLCDHPRLLSARTCRLLGLDTSNYSRLDGGESEANGGWDMNREIIHISDEILIKESGKLCFLITLLERLQEEGHRTLVFSQSRKMLDIIERVLTRRHFKLVRIDGTVRLVERERRISLFQSNRNYSVFLLTTQVGGVGLTLTAATRVVIFDPSWNPATDAQAVDRSYRIGQKENVVIYRLITCGTVEEKIYRRQIFKESLIRQTTGDKKNPYRYFAMQELRELFTLEDTRCSPTQLYIQSLHGAQRKSDTLLDAHVAYLHTLKIFGISDHDLMYTQEVGHEDKAENEEAHQYIEHRVQKAQKLIQLESQQKDKLMENIRNTTEGARQTEMEPSNQPKKKSAPPQHIDSLIPPVHAEPTNQDDAVILIKETDGHSIVNISSKMSSVVTEDLDDDDDDDDDDDQVLQNISNMDMSLLKNECYHQSKLQEYKDKHDLSIRSPFTHAHSLSEKENCSHKSQVISCDPPADRDSHLNDVQIIGKPYPDLSTRSPLCQAHSLSENRNCSPESQIISCGPPAKADSHLHDVQMISLPQAPNNQKPQMETEVSYSVVACPQEESSEMADLDAPTAFKPEASNLSQGSATQTSQTSDILHSESVAGSSLFQPDFQVALEDSEHKRISEREMSLCSGSSNSRFRLQLDNLCSSVAGGNESDGRPQSSNSIMGSHILDDSSATRGALRGTIDASFMHKKMPVRRIVSYSEEEEEEANPIIDLDGSENWEVPLLNNPSGTFTSTPKSNPPLEDLYFSPRIKIARRRSPSYVCAEAANQKPQTETEISFSGAVCPQGEARKHAETDAPTTFKLEASNISQGSAIQTCQSIGYIEPRVQKDQEPIQLESQQADELMGNVRNTMEGARQREMEPSNQPEKKSPPPQPDDSLLPPLHAQPTTKDDDVIHLTETAGPSIISISSQMSSLVIENLDDDDVVDDDDDDDDDDKVLQHIYNMDRFLFKNEYYHQASIPESKQNPDLSTRFSLCQAHSLSEKENSSPESQIISCGPPAKADSHLHDVQMISLPQAPNNQKLQMETEVSYSVVACPQGEASEMADLDAPTAFKPEASNLSQGSATQTSQTSDILHSESVAGSSLFQPDFQVALEDSEHKRISEREMSLCSGSSNSRFRLQLDSLCNSVAGGNESDGRPQSSNSIMGSHILDDSSATRGALRGTIDASFMHKKMPVRRIVSYSEEEEEEANPIIDLDGSENWEVPLLNNPSGTFTSTPKSNPPLEDLYFSPRIKIARRRSPSYVCAEAANQKPQTETEISFSGAVCPQGEARKHAETDAPTTFKLEASNISQGSAIQTCQSIGYIEPRVQKDQEPIQLESQQADELMGNVRNTMEGARQREMEPSNQPEKKSPPPQPDDSLLPPLHAQPTTKDDDVIHLTETAGPSIISISSQMSSLVIENLDDDDVVDDDDDDDDDDKVLQHIYNMDRFLFKNEYYHQASIPESKQNPDLSTRFSLCQAHSLSEKENSSPESQIISCGPPAKADSHLHDVQMISLPQAPNNQKPQMETEVSYSVVACPQGESSEMADLDAPTAFKPEASNLSQGSATQTSQTSDILHSESVAGSSLYQADFRLALEDSEDRQFSEKEMSFCSESANSGFRLQLDNSVAGGNESNGRPQSRNSITSSCILVASSAAGEALAGNSAVPFVYKKKPAKTTVSDSGEEEENRIIDLDESESCEVPLLNNPSGIFMPTPKSKHSLEDLYFSPKTKIAGRWSPAYVCADNLKPQTETEISFSGAACPQGEARKHAEIDAPTTFKREASNLSQGSVMQSSSISAVLHSGSVPSSSLYQADFHLGTEDSEHRRLSEKEMSSCLESVNSGFRLLLVNSVVGDNESYRTPQSCNSIMGSLILDSSNAACEALTGNSDVSFNKKKPVGITVSDSEEEENPDSEEEEEEKNPDSEEEEEEENPDSEEEEEEENPDSEEEEEEENPIVDLDQIENREFPFLNNPSGILMSTPKSIHPLEDRYFSPRIKIAGRRSTASRRSLVDVFLNQMEDMRETVGDVHDASHERSFSDNLQRELTQEFSGQESGDTEEKPLGEILDPKGKSGSFLDLFRGLFRGKF